MTLSVISVSISSSEISSGDNFLRCAISVSVLVRSTRVDRPSSEERSRMER